MVGSGRGVGRVALLCAVALMVGTSTAAAAVPTVGSDGVTAPVFAYASAVRERVFIAQPGIDQDGNGVDDQIAIEVIRPAGVDAGSVPAIIEPSPYYTTVCRGNESQCIADGDSDGLNDMWPLYYDNYFVPRGYAVILAEMNGTSNSTGCPMHGGPGDVAGVKSVVDWLNNRAVGKNQAGQTIVPSWHNGKSALIGKSYDGTLANGVAATGVDGLTTIVPISAISDWYGYSRQNGIRLNTHYPASLASTVTDAARRAGCLASRNAMSAVDGDDTGDRNAFWNDRDYLKDVGNVEASVLLVHGFQDDNVKADEFSTWWAGLTANAVPRKLWLLRGGHVDPFDSRRQAWVTTLHRWFDHWLLGVDNGIMGEARVDIEDAADDWHTYADWPIPGSTPTPVYLRAAGAAEAGGIGLSAGGSGGTLTFTSASPSETTLITTPTGSQANRRVFLSPPLARDLRISGTPLIDLYAALSTAQSNMGAILVDYGAGTQVSRSGEGIQNTANRTCWGDSTAADSACYLEVVKRMQTLPDATSPWRVSRGILDSSNRDSLLVAAPVPVGTQTHFTWPLQPTEHVFKAGHQIGIVLTGNYGGFGVAGTTGTVFTVDAAVSRVILPIVGGYATAAASGGFPDGVAPTLAGVPADIAVAAPDANGVGVQFTPPTATDNETPGVQVTCEPASGSVFPVGVNTVTCSSLDAQGNRGEATFRVTVTGPAAGDPGTPPSAEAPATALDLGRRLLLVRAGARRLDVTCTLDRPVLRRCAVSLAAGGKTLGRATADAPDGAASVTVAVPLDAATVRLARRAGGLAATLQGTADQAGGGAPLGARVSVLLLPGPVVTLASDALFRGGATTLPANGTGALRTLRDQLTGARRVTCTGHTDDRGAAAANQRLGLARARSVCAFLTRGTSLAGRAASRGEAAPRASNRTAAGRAANRRVTVAVEF